MELPTTPISLMSSPHKHLRQAQDLLVHQVLRPVPNDQHVVGSAPKRRSITQVYHSLDHEDSRGAAEVALRRAETYRIGGQKALKHMLKQYTVYRVPFRDTGNDTEVPLSDPRAMR
ncbi:hypothetical protein PC114_g18278 [Phytophthora cactorum]|nr:hypothetical protein PC114_g18278 [Phytophthora cactorum]